MSYCFGIFELVFCCEFEPKYIPSKWNFLDYTLIQITTATCCSPKWRPFRAYTWQVTGTNRRRKSRARPRSATWSPSLPTTNNRGCSSATSSNPTSSRCGSMDHPSPTSPQSCHVSIYQCFFLFHLKTSTFIIHSTQTWQCYAMYIVSP